MYQRIAVLTLVAGSCALVTADHASGSSDGLVSLVSSQLSGLVRQAREGATVLVDSFTCLVGPACSADDKFQGRCSPIEGDGLLGRCASRLGTLRRSPAALALLLTTAGLVVCLGNGPAVLEWMQVQGELLSIQCRYLGQPLSVQKEVYLLLWLEKARRLENLKVARYRRQGRLDPVTGHLPHVDTLSALPSLASIFGARKPAAMKMGADDPVMKDLVLIGGGHAHAYVLKNFGMNPMPGVQVTLITRDVDTPYSGMLPGHIAGHYTRAECHIDLVRLGNFAKARIIHGEACGIDPMEKTISIRGRPSIAYDVLSINIGSSPQLSSAPAESEEGEKHVSELEKSIKQAHKKLADGQLLDQVTPVKPIDKFSARWNQILERAYALATTVGPDGSKGARVRMCVVGGGAGGVELALAMQVRLRKEYEKRGACGDLVEMTLVGRGKTMMPAHNPMVQQVRNSQKSVHQENLYAT